MNYSQFTFGSAIFYILGCITKIPVLFRGISYFPNCFKAASYRLSENGNRIDMTNGSLNELYDSIGAFFYVNLFCSLVPIIIKAIRVGVTSAIFSLVGLAIGMGFTLMIYSLIIYLMETKKSAWSLGVIKFLIVLGYISLAIYAIQLIFNVISIVTSILTLSVYKIIQAIVNLLFTVVTLCWLSIWFMGLSRGTVSMQQTQNSYGSYGQQDPQNYWQNDPRGVSGLGAVNSSAGVSVSAPSDSSVSNPSEVLTEQMYSCPYCSQPIHYKESPCHHCGQQVQW